MTEPLFTLAELTDLRNDLTPLAYHDAWRLTRMIRVSDGRGGSITTEQTVASGPGLLRDPGAGNEREAEIAGRLGWTKAAVLDAPLFDSLGLPLDIKPADRLYVNGTLVRVGGETTVAGNTTMFRSLVVTEQE